MNGVLIVDKPVGPTSHDIVARVRRAIREKRIGHTGTLDPLASGVLALVVGRATRLAQFLASDEKEYLAGVRLGWSTPTYDAEARIVRDGNGRPIGLQPPPTIVDVPVTDIAAALQPLRGSYDQLPPPFSAKKIGGTPAYRLARQQKPVDVRAVPVTVGELELVDAKDGLVELRVACSSGFYVRSLAHALGEALGCGAHLESLRRIRAGEFGIDRATPLAEIEDAGVAALDRVVPMPSLLSRLPHVVVNERGARRVAHGNALAAEDIDDGVRMTAAGADPVRVLNVDGALIAIGRAERDGVLQPVVVLV